MKDQIRQTVRITALPGRMVLMICLIAASAAGARPADFGDKGITIGFLVSESPDENPRMREAVDAVQLAADRVNSSGGIGGRQVHIVVRSVDGLWGAGSKEAVDLITKQGAKALLGFLDGRSAHLVEQVCTKAEIPFISAISPDPTLSRINIPWFFSMMPDAETQAAVLASHLTRDGSGKAIAVISSDDFDYGFIHRHFLDEVRKKSGHVVKGYTLPSDPQGYGKLKEELSGSDADAIVFFGTSGELESLLRNPGFTVGGTPLYTPVMNFEHGRFSNSEHPVYTLRPEGLDSEMLIAFRENFSVKVGYQPGTYAAYVFDGMNALLEALKTNGTGNHRLQAALREMETNGIHGVISFDSDGMIRQQPAVVQVGDK